MTSGTNKLQLPPISAEYGQCFDKLVPAPTQNSMTTGDVVRLITDLKSSEKSKSRCGKRLITLYNTYKNRL